MSQWMMAKSVFEVRYNYDGHECPCRTCVSVLACLAFLADGAGKREEGLATAIV